MDYDSSSKFISSLAKFLQSLCNGYVEFDNGVEVIGHIYLSVDTGKKIDYILNEKVCKTDENSVTFISNSFHAQPAEKPKPNSKKGKGGDNSEEKPTDNNVVEIDSERVSKVEPKSTNIGTIARNQNKSFQSSSPSLGKRPFSPHSKSGPSSSKRNRNELHDQSFGVSDNGNLSTGNLTSDPLRGQTHQSSSGLPHSDTSQSYDPGYNPAIDNSVAEESEERDIKPSMDTDVTFVKEEFQPPSSHIEDERGQGIDGSFSSMFSNQPYSDGGPSNQSFGQASRLSYSGAGERSDMYDDNSMMSSQMEGNDGGGDPSVGVNLPRRPRRKRSKTKSLNMDSGCQSVSSADTEHSCESCGRTYRYARDLTRHRWKCLGLRVLECSICNTQFYRKDHLNAHMKKHCKEGNEEIPFTIKAKELTYDPS